jgi:hypothetical protein
LRGHKTIARRHSGEVEGLWLSPRSYHLIGMLIGMRAGKILAAIAER